MSVTTTPPVAGILSSELEQEREHIVSMLTKAYWMEVETVISYLACSINPDGVRAQEVIRSLAEDVGEELGHARQFGARIKELYGVVPGSMDFRATQDFLQPPDDQRDIVAVIEGVIAAETGAIEHYGAIVAATDDVDPVTNDLVIDILHDEQRHRRLFEGFLREYAGA
jgi:bacterioferritin